MRLFHMKLSQIQGRVVLPRARTAEGEGTSLFMTGFVRPRCMKSCHVAALALVGWFLMVPPDRPKLTDTLDWTSTAPLRTWQLVQRFDPKSACEKRRLEIISDAKHSIKSDAAANHSAAVLTDYAIANNATCVSRDDPRLKK
jgi:hypothetical protein